MATQVMFDEYDDSEICGQASMFVEYLTFCRGHRFNKDSMESLVYVKEFLDQFISNALYMRGEAKKKVVIEKLIAEMKG